MDKKLFAAIAVSGLVLATGAAFGAAHSKLMVKGSDQDVSGGTVTAAEVVADADGWLVVHRTDASKKPGPVVGHAALEKGSNKNVTAKLDAPIKKGDMLMLMLHGEEGGQKPGVFEYTLGSKLDGPVKVNGKLVMSVITAK